MYVFFRLEGGGEMIDIMRVANRTKDYTAIDAMIKENIPKFLYNEGEGKLVTVSEIVRRRNNTFSKVKNIVGTTKAEDEQLNGELQSVMQCVDCSIRL